MYNCCRLFYWFQICFVGLGGGLGCEVLECGFQFLDIFFPF